MFFKILKNSSWNNFTFITSQISSQRSTDTLFSQNMRKRLWSNKTTSV